MQSRSDVESTCQHVRGDKIIPTSRSETASEVNIFVDEVILLPGFHKTKRTKLFAMEAMNEVKMNITPNIVVNGGSNELIRVEQFILLQCFQE